MADVYSTYDAKAKFGEIMRKVRSGQRVVISYRGEEIAEIRLLEKPGRSFERVMKRLESEGVIGPRASRRGKLRCLKRKPGALSRFLESRD